MWFVSDGKGPECEALKSPVGVDGAQHSISRPSQSLSRSPDGRPFQSIIAGGLISLLSIVAGCSDTVGNSEPIQDNAPVATNAAGGAAGAPSGPVSTPVAPIQTTAREDHSRLLSQATFGPSMADIEAMTQLSPSQWFVDETNKPATEVLPLLLANLPAANDAARDQFWQNAIEADDQLRQRMAFALSQILVISQNSGQLQVRPLTVAAYMDILSRNAFGNFRDLIEDVTYSPAMAVYLTYLNNRPANPARGRVPDENYAREIMQLFTIGLLELEADGTTRLDAGGDPIETYDNDDVTELAKVFTGLGLAGKPFPTGVFAVARDNPNDPALYLPLEITDSEHATEEKTFLGTIIPPNTPGAQSIDIALDTLFDHPNTPPFIARQLIQRFTTSDPSDGYVFVVANAFRLGTYRLPDGTVVGTGERGDLTATLAAVLFSDFARETRFATDSTFGKLREPVLRFTHWARAFNVNSADATTQQRLNNTGSGQLGQEPYESPSVFNFYRPGYVAPGTESGDLGLTAPELQITNGPNIIGYPNFLELFIRSLGRIDPSSFQPDYSEELALADDPAALVDRLDLLLAYGALSEDMRLRIIELLGEITLDPGDMEDRRDRVDAAILMIMTSSDYIVLK